MRMLTRWAIKLSIAGVLYIAATQGTTLKLPATILGYQVPAALQQLVDGNSDVVDLRETQKSLKAITDALNN